MSNKLSPFLKNPLRIRIKAVAKGHVVTNDEPDTIKDSKTEIDDADRPGRAGATG